jgi:NADH:ubiquinone reductase (H+-translocating)
VQEGARATSIDERGVTYEAGGTSRRIDTRTVIWAAGVRAAPFTDSLARATGARTDRGGRIEVNSDLTVPGHPEISVIGDVAAVEGRDGTPLPGLATVAIQQAHHVTKAIRPNKPGAETPFRYLDKGALAVVGAAGPSARSGGSSCRAGPRSTPTSPCISTTSVARWAADSRCWSSGSEPASASVKAP